MNFPFCVLLRDLDAVIHMGIKSRYPQQGITRAATQRILESDRDVGGFKEWHGASISARIPEQGVGEWVADRDSTMKEGSH